MVHVTEAIEYIDIDECKARALGRAHVFVHRGCLKRFGPVFQLIFLGRLFLANCRVCQQSGTTRLMDTRATQIAKEFRLAGTREKHFALTR
jgi:hypothetical protein